MKKMNLSGGVGSATRRSILSTLLGVVCWSFISTALANPTAINGTQGLAIGTVIDILQGDVDEWGDCMVRLSTNGAGVNPNAAIGACGNDWISLDCNGTYQSKAVGASMLSAAQLSLVTGYRVGVYFDSTRKHNGAYCSAFRVDSANAP